MSTPDRTVERGHKARQSIFEGIELFADVIGRTLGPQGRHVVLDTNAYSPYPIITNDGATIAQELAGDTELAQVGAKLAREVANKTNDLAGDGTTTATVLFHAIVAEGMKALGTSTPDAVALRRGVEEGARAVIEAVQAQKVDISDLEALTDVATIACRNTTEGLMVAELVYKLGPDALVTLEDTPDAETTSELTEGLELRGGLQSPLFLIDKERQQSVMEDVLVFVTNHSLTTGVEAVKLMEAAAARGKKQAVVIASSVDGEALRTCLGNWIEGKFQLLPLRVMAYGQIGEEALRDVAAVSGGHFFDSAVDRLPTRYEDQIEPEHFGTIGRIVATKEKITIMDGAGDREGRIKELQAKLPHLKDYEQESTEERIAKLRSGVGRIYVGGVTDTEQEERKKRIEDALHATKAALESGVVAGGGAALYRAARQGVTLETHGDEGLGVKAVLNACTRPLHLMAENGSVELDKAILQRLIEEPGMTVDFKTAELVDARKHGILDPVKVTVAALSHAATTAALFLTTESAVVLTGEPKE